MQAVILGCGYTGMRVAVRLLEAGARVLATARNPESLDDLRQLGAETASLDAMLPEMRPLRIEPGAVVLYSIPTVDAGGGLEDCTSRVLETLHPAPVRVVYLSTTGVYGTTRDVDETTPANPTTLRERLRWEAENAVSSGPWSSMILRPAAIYGPGRGLQVSMARGDYKLVGDGQNFVSRIHVEDLAVHCTAALSSAETGAWPVADDHPCTAREIAQFCAELLHVPMPDSVSADRLHETRRADRKVDGGAVRRVLGVQLTYPSYRIGIPASL